MKSMRRDAGCLVLCQTVFDQGLLDDLRCQGAPLLVFAEMYAMTNALYRGQRGLQFCI